MKRARARTGAPGSRRTDEFVPDGVPAAVTADPLVAAVQKQVTDRAHRNPHAADGFSFGNSREDRGLLLTTRVDIGHKSATAV